MMDPILTPEQEKTIVDACGDEVQAPGLYRVSPGRRSSDAEDLVPRAWPIRHLGATDSGASAINSCIRRRAGY